MRGRVRFGVFEADLRTGELWKNGSKVRLQEQPFQVLALLLERRGNTVTRDELRNRLWTADTFVDFDHGLNKAINKIRETLGDSAASPRFIETVARRGYRFIADVARCRGCASPTRPRPSVGDFVPTRYVHPSRSRSSARSAWRLASTLTGLALTLASLVLLVWVLEFRGRSVAARSDRWRCFRWRASPVTRRRNISLTA